MAGQLLAGAAFMLIAENDWVPLWLQLPLSTTLHCKVVRCAVQVSLTCGFAAFCWVLETLNFATQLLFTLGASNNVTFTPDCGLFTVHLKLLIWVVSGGIRSAMEILLDCPPVPGHWRRSSPCRQVLGAPGNSAASPCTSLTVTGIPAIVAGADWVQLHLTGQDGVPGSPQLPDS